MKLHNQSANKLSWDMGGATFSCDPWGAVEVPERLVALCQRRQLPLGQSPIAPEAKATARAKAADTAAKSDELRVLRGQLAEAQAQARAADKELESVRCDLANEAQLRATADAQSASSGDALKSAKSDMKALEAKLHDAAGRIADLEQAQQQKTQPQPQQSANQRHGKHRR